MNKYLTKPGFELIFALSLIAIIGLPPLVFAQGTKDMEIRITNGDTIINGKNIKELSTADRKQALRDIENLGNAFTPKNSGQRHLVLRKRGSADTSSEKIIIENGDKDPAMADGFFRKDTMGHVFKFRMKRLNGKDSTFTFNYRMNDDMGERFDDRGPGEFFPPRGSGREFMRHRNVQIFDYSNIGSDGITTHVNFRVNEPSPEKIKEIAGTEKAGLEITDLNIIPEFSSGKTTLMFSLPAHTVAEVKLSDNDGKLIWSAKAMNGNFNKSFVLGLNGVYFLQVKQAGKVALKRIMKGE